MITLRKPLTILLGLILIVNAVKAQQIKVTFRVQPKTATLTFDGKEMGTAGYQKISMGFNERKGITQHQVTITAKGYESKEYFFDAESPKSQEIKVDLQRSLPSFDPSPNFHIELEKVVSGIEYSTDVGSNTRWKYRFNEEIDLTEKTDDINEVLVKMGLKTLEHNSDDLFDTGNKRPKTADVLIAAKVEEFKLDRVNSQGVFVSYGSNYKSAIRINWQFYDRHQKEIIHKSTIESDYSFNSGLITQEFYNSIVENLMVLFNEDKELVELLSKHGVKRIDFSEDKSSKSSDGDSGDGEGGDDAGSSDEDDSAEDDFVYYDEITKIPNTELENVEEFSDLVAIAMNASVTVIIDDKGHGSGVVVSPNGYIVTNHHVITDAKYVDVQFSNGITLPAEIITSSEKHDLALIKVAASRLTALPIIHDSKEVREGDGVFVVGSPQFVELGQSVSKGIISGKRNLEGVKMLQTDTEISPGNSGSPLINMRGEVIGIVNMKLVGDGVAGLSFAIDGRYLYSVLGLEYE